MMAQSDSVVRARFAQERLELSEELLARIEIRAVRRQIQQGSADRADRLLGARPMWVARLSSTITWLGGRAGASMCST